MADPADESANPEIQPDKPASVAEARRFIATALAHYLRMEKARARDAPNRSPAEYPATVSARFVVHQAIVDWAMTGIDEFARAAHKALAESREATKRQEVAIRTEREAADRRHQEQQMAIKAQREAEERRIAENDRKGERHQKIMYGLIALGMCFTAVQAWSEYQQATHSQAVQVAPPNPLPVKRTP